MKSLPRLAMQRMNSGSPPACRCAASPPARAGATAGDFINLVGPDTDDRGFTVEFQTSSTTMRLSIVGGFGTYTEFQAQIGQQDRPAPSH